MSREHLLVRKQAVAIFPPTLGLENIQCHRIRESLLLFWVFWPCTVVNRFFGRILVHSLRFSPPLNRLRSSVSDRRYATTSVNALLEYGESNEIAL